MQLNEAIEQLQQAGLGALARDNYIVVARSQAEIKNRPLSAHSSFEQATVEDDIRLLEELEHFGVFGKYSTIEPHDGGWVFIHRRGYIPGPGPEDLYYELDTLEQAIHLALSYYLDPPVVIRDWVFPLHHHPHWTIRAIETLLSTICQISVAEWNIVLTRYYADRLKILTVENPSQQEEWDNISSTSVVIISHHNRSDIELIVRRDLAEAFIVAKHQDSTS